MKRVTVIVLAAGMAFWATGASAQQANMDFATAVQNLARTPGTGVSSKGVQQPLAYAPAQQGPVVNFTPGQTLFDRAIQQRVHKGRASRRAAVGRGKSRTAKAPKLTLETVSSVRAVPVLRVAPAQPLPKLADGYQAPTVEISPVEQPKVIRRF